MARIWHFDPKNTTKNLSIRPNQLHESVLGAQMTLLVEENFVSQNFSGTQKIILNIFATKMKSKKIYCLRVSLSNIERKIILSIHSLVVDAS